MKRTFILLIILFFGSPQIIAQQKKAPADSLKALCWKITGDDKVGPNYFPAEYFSLPNVRKIVVTADKKEYNRTIFLDENGRLTKSIFMTSFGPDSIEVLYKNDLPERVLWDKGVATVYSYTGDTVFINLAGWPMAMAKRKVRKGNVLFNYKWQGNAQPMTTVKFINGEDAICYEEKKKADNAIFRDVCYSNIKGTLPLTITNKFSGELTNAYITDTTTIKRTPEGNIIAEMQSDGRVERMIFIMKDNRPVAMEYYGRATRYSMERRYRAVVRYE